MTCTFEQLLEQAKVTLAKNGLWLTKEHRSCEATARLLVAVRALVDSANSEELKAEVEKTKLAKENSRLATQLAERERDLRDNQRSAFKRGLEGLPDVSESQRDRLLTVNGG